MKYNYLSIGLCTAFLLYAANSWSANKNSENLITTEQKSYPIENKNLNESSGLACSNRDKHVLWSHNDSGHMPIIYAMNHKGKDLATFYIEENSWEEKLIANDWEDMDAFEYQGGNYLLIADTGDNFRLRFDYQIYIIKEPDLKNKQKSIISPAWSFSFKYEDGHSYDVESVAVDVINEKIILLSKRTDHALMFALPLNPKNTDVTQIARKIGEFKNIKKASALDISADGQLMSINTYARIHRFYRSVSTEKKLKNSWVYKDSLKYKNLFQPEAMCLSKSGKKYYVTSERKSKLVKVKVPL